MFKELTDNQIAALDSLLSDTVMKAHDEPGAFHEDYVEEYSTMWSAAREEAKSRRLWWAMH